MKYFKSITTAVIAVLALSSLTLTDIFTSLKTSEEQAKDMVMRSFAEGFLQFPKEGCKALSIEKRPEMVRLVGAFAKKYAQSEHFKQSYAEYREQIKPVKNEAIPYDEANQNMIQQMKKSIADSETQLKSVQDAEMKKILEETIVAMKEQIQQMEVMSSEQKAYFEMADEEMKKQNEQNYQQQLADFEQQYPENHQKVIKLRLREFVQIAKSVDFNAQTKVENNKIRFVNSAYEQKPSEWKLCFRAGKPAIDEAVKFAELWLKELESVK
jgi:hypothetical protein